MHCACSSVDCSRISRTNGGLGTAPVTDPPASKALSLLQPVIAPVTYNFHLRQMSTPPCVCCVSTLYKDSAYVCRWWHCAVINTGPLGHQVLLRTRLWTEVSSAVVPHFEVPGVAFNLLTSRCQFLHCRRRWGERSSGGVCVTEHWLAIHHCNTSVLPSNRVRERGTTQVGPSGC